jgi:hypothetical protein
MAKMTHLGNSISSKPMGNIEIALILPNQDVGRTIYAQKHEDRTSRES